MINWSLLKLSFLWDFYDKKSVELGLLFFSTAKQYCVMKIRELSNFQTLINISVTVGQFLL